MCLEEGVTVHGRRRTSDADATELAISLSGGASYIQRVCRIVCYDRYPAEPEMVGRLMRMRNGNMATTRAPGRIPSASVTSTERGPRQGGGAVCCVAASVRGEDNLLPSLTIPYYYIVAALLAALVNVSTLPASLYAFLDLIHDI